MLLLSGAAGTALGGEPTTIVWPADLLVHDPNPDDQVYADAALLPNGTLAVVWADSRLSNTEIFAQLMDRSGNRLWTGDLQVSSTIESPTQPAITTDPGGNIIVVWERALVPHLTVKAQRIAPDGSLLWGASGKVVNQNLTGLRFNPDVSADAAGNTFVVWSDTRSGAGGRIYGQKLDGSGTPLWGSQDLLISDASWVAAYPRIATLANGSSVVAWDYADPPRNISAQWVRTDGTRRWQASGVRVSGAAVNPLAPAIAADPTGVVVVAWHDSRNGTDDIFAQRIGPTGTVLWGSVDVQVNSIATDRQERPTLAFEGSGGVVVVWDDFRDGAQMDQIAQRLDASGNALWAPEGVKVNQFVAANQYTAQVTYSPSGPGFFVVWNDDRSGQYFDIYAQFIDELGSVDEFEADIAASLVIAAGAVIVALGGALPRGRPNDWSAGKRFHRSACRSDLRAQR